jgi:hypothetical protein
MDQHQITVQYCDEKDDNPKILLIEALNGLEIIDGSTV